MSKLEPWSVPVRLSDIARQPLSRRLEPDEAVRAAIARDLDLEALPAFSAQVAVSPWHDGAEIEGRWTARVTYRCGLTLEPFDDDLEGQFTVRAVPPSSLHATAPQAPDEDAPIDLELEIDVEADDPPDVLEGETIDLGAYLVEHLALELEPFPRKPGAVFEPPIQAQPESPFAVLKRLKED
ncbi:MAG: hypothetical protein B7Y99_11965 [Caulobacterales bacterium 32-69-10]|nr:MAG: hypothetical protein B7Y99_11965 [Caulobacterales bacterium 32-69-10]